MQRICQAYLRGDEFGRIRQADDAAGDGRDRIGRMVFPKVDEIESFLKGQGGVERIDLPFGKPPVEEAEVQRGRFGHLGNYDTLSRRMHGAGSDEEMIPRLRLHPMEQAFGGPVLASLVKRLRADLAPEAQIQDRSGTGGDDIPEFGLAQEVIALGGDPVVRMDPQRRATSPVQSLDQHRELPPVGGEDPLAHDTVHVHLHDLGEGVGRKPAVPHHRIGIAQVSQVPGLVRRIRDRDQFEGIQFLFGFHMKKAQKRVG